MSSSSFSSSNYSNRLELMIPKRYTYIKNLPGHAGPVAAVDINELTGDIITCAGSFLYLWDIHGIPVASINTVPSPREKAPSSQILCVAQSQFNEWDRQNVIITGSSDGVVRMWSLDYVEVPVQQANSNIVTTPLEEESSEVASITRLAKKMSVSMSGDCLSSLRDASAREHSKSIVSEQSVELDEDNSSDTEDCEELEEDTAATSTRGDASPMPGGSVLEDGSPLDIEPSMMGSPPPDSPHHEITAPAEIQGAETAEDSFVVVSSPSKEAPSVVVSGVEIGLPADELPSMRPGDGYMWSRQLVFRAKLTMHTAFERADNAEPAAVTALAMSKDHRTLYVGDERGRVFSWVVSNKPGKGFVDHWMRDDTTDSCQDCKVRFTIYERRHHCRNCGRLYCSSCSRYQADIPRLSIHQPVRVCRACFTQLNLGAGTKNKKTQKSP